MHNSGDITVWSESALGLWLEVLWWHANVMYLEWGFLQRV